MTDSSAIKPGSPPKLFMVVVFIAVPQFTREVQFFNVPMFAHSAEEAVEQLQFIFTLNSYDPVTESWSMYGVPVITWHICAVPYPKELEELILKEQGALTPDFGEGVGAPAPDTAGQVFQLFPQKTPKPDEVSPDNVAPAPKPNETKPDESPPDKP